MGTPKNCVVTDQTSEAMDGNDKELRGSHQPTLAKRVCNCGVNK